MIYKETPTDFKERYKVVSCFVELTGKILLLHRQDHKPHGNLWGVPAGKVDRGEDLKTALVREVKQETGLQVVSPNFVGKVYVRYPDYDFTYFIYYVQLKKQVNVIINPIEHKDYKWISPKDALSMPLIQDLDECIKLFYQL